MKKLKKLLLVGAAGVLGAATLSGCSAISEKERANFNDGVLAALNQSAVVSEQVQTKFDDFEFLSVGIEKTLSEKYSTMISGFAKYDEGESQGFVRLGYLLNENFFEGIKSDDKNKILSALIKAISEVEMVDFEITPVSSFDKVASTMEKVSSKKLEDYSYVEGKVFDLGSVKINTEEGFASFEVKSYDLYSKRKYSYNPALKAPSRRTVYKSETRSYRIKIDATIEELAQMSENKIFVFEKFAEYVENNQLDNYQLQVRGIDNSEYDVEGYQDLDYEEEFDLI